MPVHFSNKPAAPTAHPRFDYPYDGPDGSRALGAARAARRRRGPGGRGGAGDDGGDTQLLYQVYELGNVLLDHFFQQLDLGIDTGGL